MDGSGFVLRLDVLSKLILLCLQFWNNFRLLQQKSCKMSSVLNCLFPSFPYSLVLGLVPLLKSLHQFDLFSEAYLTILFDNSANYSLQSPHSIYTPVLLPFSSFPCFHRTYLLTLLYSLLTQVVPLVGLCDFNFRMVTFWERSLLTGGGRSPVRAVRMFFPLGLH
jgi:hypothetical protein